MANPEVARTIPGRGFEMPDGWNNVFGLERFRAAEGLFDEKAVVAVSAVTEQWWRQPSNMTM